MFSSEFVKILKKQMLKAFASLMYQSCLKKNICNLRSLCSTLELMKGTPKAEETVRTEFLQGDLK